MTRIYFKPQGVSARAGAGAGGFNRARKPNFKGTHLQQHHLQHKDFKDSEDAHRDEDGWRSKLEPSAIEQIADGLEKMVLSWTQQPNKVHYSEPDFNPAHAHDDTHSILSSDAIKSATMEIVENGDQFSIGTKETTISFVHHHEQQQHTGSFRQSLHPHHPQTLVVDTIGEADSFMQDFMNGDILTNSLLSIQNGEPGNLDYHQMNTSAGAPSALWYLTPTLALPNTLSYGKDFAKSQQKCREFQTDRCIESDDCAHLIENEQVSELNGNLKAGQWNCTAEHNNLIMSNGAVEFDTDSLQADTTVSEKLACKLETIGSKIWNETVEINGGSKIKNLLGRKLSALGNGLPPSEGLETQNAEYYKKKVEELQIALLECAMEYEVKIVEMKMKTLHSKSQERQIEPGKDVKSREESDSGHSDGLKDKRDAQRVDYLKKQLSRLQREKAAAARELSDLRKRERQFDLQRRSLDDALSRVNFLQSELARRDQDIVDCRLREKEAKAQLYELQLGLQKAQAAQIEPRKLLTLLPALKDWIQSSKKVSYDLARADHPERADHSPQIDNIVYAITKEIQMLQKALSQVINKN